MDVSGRWALITGAGNGIGRGIALALAERGASVVALDIERGAAEQTAALVREKGVDAQACALDLCDSAALHATAEQLRDQLDIAVVVNNAGVGVGGTPLVKSTQQNMRWTMEVNFMALCHLCMVFAKHMSEREAPGWIVNTGSEHSIGVPHIGNAIYTASKHAVLGLSDVLRCELPDHVGISILCPGLVDTSIWKSSERRGEAYGGGSDANPQAQAFMQQGMDPMQVGERVAQAIEQEQFYIFTHAHAVEFAQERHQAVEAAFAQQAPRYDGDDEYHVGKLLAKMRGQ